MSVVSALFVAKEGAYFDLPDVDPWDESRDARLYAGPNPVVAHPPCARWCQLAGLVQARYGYRIGDDGGCFESALSSVRRWGGVLEHPAYTRAWETYGLASPPFAGGWMRADLFHGWTCHVEQGHYGHLARKATWLYAVDTERPELRWGKSVAKAWCSWNHNNDGRRVMPRLSRKQAASTPPAFRDVLLALARSV